jgi:hypothetical protein
MKMLRTKSCNLTLYTTIIMFVLFTSPLSFAQSTSEQQFQTLEKARKAINTIISKKEECVTIIYDLNPPTNVRSTPVIKSNNILRRLKPFTFINVINNQNGWLEINTPVRGWVSVDLTLASCGNYTRPSQKGFKKLVVNSLSGDKKSFDLLVRFTYQEVDGVWADILDSETLDELLQKQPDLFIMTLDNQTESGRREFLQFFLISASELKPQERRKKLKNILRKYNNSPTDKTLQQLNLK